MRRGPEPHIALTRRYRFPAAHVLQSPRLSAAENQHIYGKCANPNGHGHDYGLEVTVTGPMDEETGALVPLDWLDGVVGKHILGRLGHQMLNADVWFQELVPTAENIVARVRRELEEALRQHPSLRLLRLRLDETRRNRFGWDGE